MPLFSYVARTEDGKKVTGLWKADSEEEILNYLMERGLVPVSVQAFSESSQSITRRKRKKHFSVKLEDYLFLARQMAVMLDAGVPLMRVLEVIKNETASLKLEKALEKIKEDVAAGWSLEKAMAKHPDVFDKFWVSVVRTGEATGELGRILKRLADHIERQASFYKKIVTALVYPGFLLAMTIGAGLFLSIYLIPKFRNLFSTFGQDLPLITQIVFSVSDFIRTKYWILIVFVIIVFLVAKFFISTPGGKRMVDSLLLEIPFLRDFVRVFIMENLAANLAILTETGVPLLTALDIVAESSNNYIVTDYILRARSKVKEGVPLAVALESTGFFDSILVQMISVGEEVGEVPEMLDKLAKYYDEEMENRLARFTSMFEPIILIIMAGLIGILVAAIFIPIFRMAMVNFS